MKKQTNKQMKKPEGSYTKKLRAWLTALEQKEESSPRRSRRHEIIRDEMETFVKENGISEVHDTKHSGNLGHWKDEP